METVEKIEDQSGISIKEAFKIFIIFQLVQLGIGVILGIGISLIFGSTHGFLEYFKLDEYIKYVDIIEDYINRIVDLGVFIYCMKYIKKYIKPQNFDFKIKQIPKMKEFIFAFLLVIGYILVYGNTLEILLSDIAKCKWLKEALKEELSNPIIGFVSICIIAPICEELFYRGILVEQMYRRYGSLKAVLIPSFIFAVIHGNIEQGVNAFFAGIILGYAYVKTKSLIIPIFMHFLNNSISILPDIYNIDVSMLEKFNSYIFILGAILIFISYKGFKKFNKENKLSYFQH